MALSEKLSPIAIPSYRCSEILPVYNAARTDWKKAYSEYGYKVLREHLPALVDAYPAMDITTFAGICPAMYEYPTPGINVLACLYETHTEQGSVHLLANGTLLFFCLFFECWDLAEKLLSKGYDFQDEFKGSLIDCSKEVTALTEKIGYFKHPAILHDCGLHIVNQVCFHNTMPQKLRNQLIEKLLAEKDVPLRISSNLLCVRDFSRIAKAYTYDLKYIRPVHSDDTSKLYTTSWKRYHRNIAVLEHMLFDETQVSEEWTHYLFAHHLREAKSAKSIHLLSRYIEKLYMDKEYTRLLECLNNAVLTGPDIFLRSYYGAPIREQEKLCVEYWRSMLAFLSDNWNKVSCDNSLSIALLKHVIIYSLCYDQHYARFAELEDLLDELQIHFACNFADSDNWAVDDEGRFVLPGLYFSDTIIINTSSYPLEPEKGFHLLFRLIETAWCHNEAARIRLLEDVCRYYPAASQKLLDFGIIRLDTILFDIAYLDDFYIHNASPLIKLMSELSEEDLEKIPTNPLIHMYERCKLQRDTKAVIQDEENSNIVILDEMSSHRCIGELSYANGTRYLYCRDDIYLYADDFVIMVASGDNIYSIVNNHNTRQKVEHVQLSKLQLPIMEYMCSFIINRKLVRDIPLRIGKEWGNSIGVDRFKAFTLDECALKKLPPVISNTEYKFPISEKDLHTIAKYTLLMGDTANLEVYIKDFQADGCANFEIKKGND